MIVEELIDEIQLHIHDTATAELTRIQLLTFLNSAARDFRGTGWYRYLEDDEGITVAAQTYDYDIPRAFATIKEVRLEEVTTGAFLHPVPDNHWKPVFSNGKPRIRFSTLTALSVGRSIRLIGQAKPSLYGDETAIVDSGMEYLLRERTVSYVLMALSPGNSELANRRAQLGLARRQMQRPYPPAEFRLDVNAKIVPLRG